jgi:hypothetical protein
MTPRKQAALATATAAAAAARRREATEAYAGLVGPVRQLRRAGLSYSRIAVALNTAGFTTRQGMQFHAAQVRNILVRAAATRRPR